jgi:23S rRNA pseudouridine955/2504/2580 synthase
MQDETQKTTPSKVQLLEITEHHEGQRLDNFLLTRLKGVPRSLIYRIVRKGEVRVNKGRIKPDYRLKSGDLLRIPPVRIAERTSTEPAAKVLQILNDAIIFEEPRFLVINKPSGMAVHGGSGLKYGVIEGLRALRPDAPYLELVHRLDRETSGCLIIAKKRSALRRFHEMLRENKMDKRYRALVKGEWFGKSRTVNAPLSKNEMRSGERIVTVNKAGKPSRSIIRPLSIGEQASLIEVKLETGRTHQARVHSASIGHPIAGDEKYGDKAFNKLMRSHGLKRLFLHAVSLRFTLEPDEKPIEISAPLSDDLLQLLQVLGLR